MELDIIYNKNIFIKYIFNLIFLRYNNKKIENKLMCNRIFGISFTQGRKKN